jgi:hypothetical protein
VHYLWWASVHFLEKERCFKIVFKSQQKGTENNNNENNNNTTNLPFTITIGGRVDV